MVLTRLVGLMFMVGSTLAIGLSILLLKFTFDYPLLRIVIASLMFFGSVYLLRVLRIGVVFFIVAIVVIYVQSFVDQTDQADLLIRAVLWVWVAVNYPIALTMVVNTLLLPAEPQLQLKAEIHRQLAALETRLTPLIDGATSVAPITLAAVQQGALTLQKLLRFTTMRDARYREHQASQLACIATVSRLHRGASELPDTWPGASAAQLAMLRELLANVRALDESVMAGVPYRYVSTATARRTQCSRHDSRRRRIAAGAACVRGSRRERCGARQAARERADGRARRMDQSRLRALLAEDAARRSRLLCVLQRRGLAGRPHDHADLPDRRAAEPGRIDAACVAAAQRGRRSAARWRCSWSCSSFRISTTSSACC